MLSAYPACFFKEKNGYSVIFPDLNYLATCGETMEEAFAMAIDCLAGYLFQAKLDGEAVPTASALEDVSATKVAESLGDDFIPETSFVNIVTVDVEEYAKIHFSKSVKKTLTIPSWMNNMALSMNINFSQVLQEALLEKINLQR